MIGNATANFVQTIGAVLFWVLAWKCLRAGVRPTRQPVFGRAASLLMATGLGMVVLALGLDALTLDDLALRVGSVGKGLCYLGIGMFLWRDGLYLRHVLRQARQLVRVLREREQQRRQVARGGDE